MSAESAEVGSVAWPKGYGRIVLDEVDSTNTHAARIADSLAEPTWILARRQTAAHGRRGRAWVNPEGNFAATLAIRPDFDAATAAQLSFVMSLALLRALASFLGNGNRTELKWPNDVLLNGGKLAGILLEASGNGKRPGRLAIGVGVNLLLAPGADEVEPGAVRPVSLFAETGRTVTPEELLDRIAAEFDVQFRLWDKEGFASYRSLWLRHAARLGEQLTARLGTERLSGIFETIDATGALILQTPEGRVAIPAGDVYF